MVFCSNEVNRNVRLRRTGPPIVPPHCFWPNGGLSGSKYPFAFSALSRKKKNVPPCAVFVPLFVTMLMTPAEAWPNSAE